MGATCNAMCKMTNGGSYRGVVVVEAVALLHVQVVLLLRVAALHQSLATPSTAGLQLTAEEEEI